MNKFKALIFVFQERKFINKSLNKVHQCLTWVYFLMQPRLQTHRSGRHLEFEGPQRPCGRGQSRPIIVTQLTVLQMFCNFSVRSVPCL